MVYPMSKFIIFLILGSLLGLCSWESFCALSLFFLAGGRYAESDPDSKTSKNNTEDPFNYIFALPTCCDLTASTLGNIALLWIDASIWQMMRGSIIIFSAILSLIFLKRKLKAHHWIGILIVVVGLFLVGLAGMIKTNEKNKENNDNANSNSGLFFVGIVLVICAQLIASSQMIIEEMLLKKEHSNL